MNSYTIELRIEMPPGVAATIAGNMNREFDTGCDEQDWLQLTVEKAIAAVLVAKTEEPGITVHAYRATRDRIAEDPEAESYGSRETGAGSFSFVPPEEEWRHQPVPALSPAGQERVRRMFAKGAAESDAYEVYAEETGAVVRGV